MSQTSTTRSSVTIDQPDCNNQENEWTYGKLACCDSCRDMVCICLCPNCYICTTAQLVEPGSICGLVTFFCPMGLICVRKRARAKKGIHGSCCGDFCSFLFCPCCTTIQMNREFLPDIIN